MWGFGQNRAVHERFSSWQKERGGRGPSGPEQSLCPHDYNLDDHHEDGFHLNLNLDDHHEDGFRLNLNLPH